MLLKTALHRFGLKCVRLDSDQVRYIAKPKAGREEHEASLFLRCGRAALEAAKIYQDTSESV